MRIRLFERETRGEKRAVILLLLVGALLRLGIVSLATWGGPYDPYSRLSGDAADYVALGISLSRGEGFSLQYQPVLSEFLQDREAAPGKAIPTAYRSPGYPVFLALVFSLLGYRLHAVILIQALMSTLTALFVYLTARELRARPLAALTFAVFYVPFAFDAASLMTECLLTFFTAALFWALVRPRSELVAGALAGVVLLVKSVTLPFLLLVSLSRGRRGWLFLAGLACVAAPWGFRNYRHAGVPYITPSYGGYQLFLLHNPANREFPVFDRPGHQNEYYEGFWNAVGEANRRAPRVADPVAQEYLEDHELFGEALGFIRADPAQAVRAAWRSLVNTWRFDIPIAHWRSGHPFANGIRWLSNLVLYAGLLPFAVWGSIHSVRHGPSGARLLAFFLLYFVVVHSPLSSQIRNRVSAMPAFFVLAASGVAAFERTRKRNRREPREDPELDSSDLQRRHP